jgi:hypothetical protein
VHMNGTSSPPLTVSISTFPRLTFSIRYIAMIFLPPSSSLIG